MSVATYKFGEKIFLGNADGLRSHIDKFFEDAAVSAVVFDLENVRLCDSYGLKFLITYHRKSLSAGKKLYLFRPDIIVREMLDNTKLSQVFTITDAMPDEDAREDARA
jgi:anti-anti-sigma factor